MFLQNVPQFEILWQNHDLRLLSLCFLYIFGLVAGVGLVVVIFLKCHCVFGSFVNFLFYNLKHAVNVLPPLFFLFFCLVHQCRLLLYVMNFSKLLNFKHYRGLRYDLVSSPRPLKMQLFLDCFSLEHL